MGSEPEACGNGTRIAAAVTAAGRAGSVLVETIAGPRQCLVGDDGTVTARMADAVLESAAYQPTSERFPYPHRFVSIGNPHITIRVSQILSLLDSLKRKFKMAILLITHDLGVIAGRADQVCIMYAGKVVERSATDQLYSNRHHPYTEALLASIPRTDQNKSETLVSIAGLPPDLSKPPAGCRFHPRCRYTSAECVRLEPRLDGATSKHEYACFHPVGEGVAPSRPIEATSMAER